jgi:hypothetical protein
VQVVLVLLRNPATLEAVRTYRRKSF